MHLQEDLVALIFLRLLDAQFAVNPGKALRAMTKPVICAVNGACVSGGLEIALSSSFVVASDRARFADTHAIPVAETQAGKGTLAHDHPRNLGAIGMTPQCRADRDADSILDG